MPSTGCIGVPAILQDAPLRPSPDTPLEALVAAAKDGDMQAFGVLYDRFWDMVFRYAYYRLPSRWHAEDITSDTFMRAHRGLPAFALRPGYTFEAWLVTIARNLISDHYKRRCTTHEVSVAEMFDLDASVGSAEYEVLGRLEDQALQAAIDRLIPAQRQCVTLRYLCRMSVSETSQIMDKPEGAIKSLMMRSLRSLARDKALAEWAASR